MLALTSSLRGQSGDVSIHEVAMYPNLPEIFPYL